MLMLMLVLMLASLVRTGLKVYLSLQTFQEESIKFGQCASDYIQKVMQHSDWLIQFTVNNFSCVSTGSISGHIVSYFSICSVVVESKCFG